MSNLAINILKLVFITVLLGISACSTQQKQSATASYQPSVETASDSNYQNVQLELNQAITYHQSTLEQLPDNITSLGALAQLHTLKGAFAEKRRNKRAEFKQAMNYAEQIMLQNDDFSSRIGNGESVWSAASALTKRESDGLGWWSTAMLYYYREGLPQWQQLFSYKRVVHAKALMDQLDAVNPSWEYGTNYFNLAIYYHALPEFAGGDIDLSAQYMAKAEDAGPSRLLIPWGKAKYFLDHNNDRETYIQSVEWLVSQDVEKDNGEHYLWRIYFKAQAIDMLAIN